MEPADRVTQPVSISVLTNIDGTGGFKISAMDFGPASENAMGIDSYEHWIRLQPDAIAALVKALLNERYQDGSTAMRHFRYYCDSKRISYEYCTFRDG